MNIDHILQKFNNKVSKQIRIEEAGNERFRVLTPFRFDDGDHLVIMLRQNEFGNWELTDNGHTFMHLSYEIDEKSLTEGTRNKIITRTLSEFGLDNRDGVFSVEISDHKYGNALYDFIQAIVRINDVNYLTRERVKSTFMEDFRAFMEEHVPSNRRDFDWNHPQLDRNGFYTVDCRINHRPKPIMVFALNNDTKTRDTTITLHQFESWNLEYESISIFENQEEINRGVLARYSDVADKQYSNLITNRPRIAKYLESALA